MVVEKRVDVGRKRERMVVVVKAVGMAVLEVRHWDVMASISTILVSRALIYLPSSTENTL